MKGWYASTAWRLFSAVQDPDTARELSAICGEYVVVATSHGDSESNQPRAGFGSFSTGRSETRSEIKRALITTAEILRDMRTDEAFITIGNGRPLRRGRGIWFRRRECHALVGKNRFHEPDTDRNAAD